MLFSRCQRSLMRVALAALALTVATSSVAAAKPRPGKGFRLFSSAITVFTPNRVQCRIFSDGSICATGSSTVGGGIWPRGTADQYVFGSGINIAGVIDNSLPKSLNGFSGDTAGGFFNNTAGSSNGAEVQPIFSSADPNDAAAWPEAAKVPLGDTEQELYDPSLRGQIAASQGDLWFISWEGDPSRLESRAHPLGIAVETRALGWNFPTGNEDIVYLIYTFYNISSANDADYVNIRPGLREILAQKGKDFVASNSAKFGVTLPQGGYAINNLFVASVSDMDVAQADANYASVNVPFALGYTYEHSFSSAASLGWTFDPSIFGVSPFFAGVGFVGVKYLKSPTNPLTGQDVGLTLFGTFTRSSSIQDPNDDKQLYRYITGGFLPTDGACSLNPITTHICFVNISSPADMRFFESSGPLNLPPGGSGTIVVAYIFAAPVQSQGCPGAGCDVKPATSVTNLNILGSASRMASGVNKIDTMTGYLDFDDADGNGEVTQAEMQVVPGSLLGKALVAQNVFNNKFLLPFAPERPDFFLLPGDNQVTVMWNRSPTETTPDPFFQVASQPTVIDPVTGSPVVNVLYDPNFRGLDVEGYRVYRGRVDNPTELQLIAQFDYGPDQSGRGIFNDFRGLMNPVPGCAPELGVQTTCPITFSVPAPGTPYVGSVPVDLVGTPVQVVPGGRVLLASGEAQILPGKADTAFLDISRGRLAQGVSTALTNAGVPFMFTDHGVRNSLRYFYAVTAFDVNSAVSGPSSLESQRKTKAVTPVKSPTNEVVSGTSTTTVLSRSGPLTSSTDPTIDPSTGRFSGPFPGANGISAGLVSNVNQILGGPKTVVVRLDSAQLGFGGNSAIFGSSPSATPNLYFYTANPGTPTELVFSVPNTLNAGGGAIGSSADSSSGTGLANDVAPIDQSNSARFEGGPAAFKFSAQVTVSLAASSYLTGQTLGCVFGDPGFDPGGNCFENGGRWFDGPSPTTNETADHPNLFDPSVSFNNAGALTGVTTISEPHSYAYFTSAWRNAEWALGGAARAADFNVYWGTAGKVDSVVDISNDVVVPFDTNFAASYGILNTAATGGQGEFDLRNTVLTATDIGCVEPLKTQVTAVQVRMPCDTLGQSPAYKLSQTAQLGQISFTATGVSAPDPILAPDSPLSPLSITRTSAVSSQPGFIFYLAGHIFLMNMPALPSAGTVWSLRTYTGAVSGDGAALPYAFTPVNRSFTAPGMTASTVLTASDAVVAATKNDLTGVHTVPDPYYVQSKYEVSTDQKVLKFVGLPQDAIIRIYSASGVLVRMLEHHGGQYNSASASQGSEMNWDLRNRNNQVVASGVYFYHIEAGDARRVGRFTVVNFAQ